MGFHAHNEDILMGVLKRSDKGLSRQVSISLGERRFRANAFVLMISKIVCQNMRAKIYKNIQF